MAGWLSTASSMSANRPSTCARIASRSYAPHSGRTPPLSAETQEWVGQQPTRPRAPARAGRAGPAPRSGRSARLFLHSALGALGEPLRALVLAEMKGGARRFAAAQQIRIGDAVDSGAIELGQQGARGVRTQ